MSKSWTDTETDKLRHHYPTTPREQLKELFPNRSFTSLRKKAKRLGLSRSRGVSDKQVSEEDMLKRLKDAGYSIVKKAPITDHVVNLDKGRYDGEPVKIGIASDTHMGSKHQQLTHLKAFYQRCYDEGVKIVLHPGDISQGIRMFRGWELEAFLHDYDSQLDYIIANYPRHEGVKTYLLLGNHDESFLKNGGGNICKAVARRRADFEFIGNFGAYVDLPGGLRAYLHHGAGGCSYARSYKQQKMMEQFSPGKKPKLLLQGHYHVASVLPDYRNSVAIMCGCFQGQGEFLRRLGLAPDIGGFIIEYAVNPGADRFDLAYIKMEWVPFRKELDHDY